MTSRFKAARALLSGLALALALAASPRDAGAAAPSPFSELRRSFDALFSQERRTTRTARKNIRLAAVPLPRARPAEFQRQLPSAARREPKPAARAAPKPAANIPFPPPRPAAAAEQVPATKPGAEHALPTVEAPAGPSACQLRLTAQIAVVQALPPISGPGECGGEDLVRLDAVVLKDGRRVALNPAATLRCPMAEAVAHWMRDDVTAAADLPSPPRSLITAASYECRGRNRIAGAQLSEHGKANALDVRGLALSDGSTIDFTDRTVAKSLRERMRQTACARFKTVLGPGSDGYHENHIHLDLRERRGGFKMCQWDLDRPAEVAAVPLPPERPRRP